jgi:transcription-repair coupling factor (superfamily II helicase)
VGWAKARSAVPIRKSARASRRSALCRHANVERIEVGPKGAVLAFRDNIFANPRA